MPTTQHRPHGAYAGPVFGDLSDKTEDTTPPVDPPKTQHRPHGAFAGPRFGTLSGKTEGSGGGGPSFDLSAPLVAGFAASFSATGNLSIVSGPTVSTVTLTLFTTESGATAVPNLTGIEWASYDAATKLSETWGASPTDSGTAESTDGSGQIVLTLTNSAKTSGQTVYVQLEHGSGASTRHFGALVTVD